MMMTRFTEGMTVGVPGGHVGTITKVDHKQKAPYYVTFDLNRIEASRPFTLMYRAEDMIMV